MMVTRYTISTAGQAPRDIEHMGLSVDTDTFSTADFSRFRQRLNGNLDALQVLLAQDSFSRIPSAGARHLGCELELYLVDGNGRPAFFNQEIQQRLQDPLLTLELNRYNLEYNLPPVSATNNPFSTIARAVEGALGRINQAAADFDCQVVPIGILPTLQKNDFGGHAMTNVTRYRALTKALQAIRGGPFHVHIKGQDELIADMTDVTLEGANTSLQIHYQVDIKEFVDTYNALQMVTPLVIALAGNSPFVFGKRLWQETRIPLFKQSIDCRRYDPIHPIPARVNFGHAWLRHSPLELFTEAVRLYEPLLPVCDHEDPMEAINSGKVPGLHELRLQQGSVWLWNRPVYDASGKGHIRIEMRALPAGPSVTDMVANTALIIGLTEVMKHQVAEYLPLMPFEYCARNFYRAAELGLNAELIWPNPQQFRPEYQTAAAILEPLMDDVPAALDGIGIAAADYQGPLDCVRQRLQTRQTGAAWQLQAYEKLHLTRDHPAALQQMLALYQHHSAANRPVHDWPMP